MSMNLLLPDLSSTIIPSTTFGGTRDYSIELSGNLEAGEILSSADAVSSNTEVLEATFVSVTGTKVNISVKSKGGPTTRMVKINIPFVGNDGSSDTYVAGQPIVPLLGNK